MPAHFDTAAVVAWRLAEAEAVAGGGDAAPDPRRRLLTAKAEAAEIEVARLKGDLLPADEVVAGWQDAIGWARALLLGIPPGAAAEVVLAVRGEAADDRAERVVRDFLRDRIDAALQELADTRLADDEDDEDDLPGGDGGRPG